MDFIDKIIEFGFELHKNIPVAHKVDDLVQQKTQLEHQPEVTSVVAQETREHKASKRHKTTKDGAHVAPQDKADESLGDDPAIEEARRFTLKIF